MIHKDFILRMIEEMVAVIHQLAGLRVAQDYKAALALLGETYLRLTRLDGEILRNAAPDTLLELLSFAGELDASRCIAAAELLKEEGDIRAELGSEDLAYACYDRALFLFVALIERYGPALLQSRIARVDAVADAISVYALPVPIGRRLFRYYRLTHRYGDAEAWLFRVLAAAPDDAETHADGFDFYHELLVRGDRELHAGGITRDDVEAGIAELREREQQAKS